MSSSDLLRSLRDADAALGSMAPSPDLEARIRARVLDRGGLRLGSMLAGARRLHRPLILAFATVAALFAVSALRGHGDVDPAKLAGGPEDPAEHIVNDRIRSDGGVREDEPGEHSAGPKPVFHMPSLEPRPYRGDHPLSPQRPAAPPPATAPSALNPSPSAMTPPTLRDDIDDRGQKPARMNNASRPAVASMGRAAGPPSAGGSSAWKPSFVARGGGDSAVRDFSPSTSRDTGGSDAPVECKTPSALRDVAVAKCEATGLLLSIFTFVEPCGGGRFGSIYFQCTSPEPEKEPDPEPEPDQCIARDFDGGETCVYLAGTDKDPIAGIQQKASAICADLGLAVSTLSVDAVDCPPGSGKVKYVCCPSPAPSPQPNSSCQEDKIGSDTCVDLSTLKAAASTRCADSGRVLASLSPLAGCPDGQASTALISCCPESL